MKFAHVCRSMAVLGLAAAIAACSAGGPALTGPGAPGALHGTIPASQHRAPGQIKARLNPAALSHKLLFVSDMSSGTIDVFTYPGWTSAGQLCCFVAPFGECTDSAGNVWLADGGANAVYEITHDGRLLNTLAVPGPFSCAINRKTGDLAVSESGNQGVAVFHNAAGQASVYNDFNFLYVDFLGYDNAGNLFVDGKDATLAFHYAELPAGSSTFTDITLSTVPTYPGAVQWDGKHMAVGDSISTIYQTSGSNVVGSTTLSTTNMYQFYIVPSYKKVIAVDPVAKTANVYRYPSGGLPAKTVQGGLIMPFGVVLSQ